MSNDALPRYALKPGHTLLWYQIESVLGKGGFGITYLAHDINLSKRVAIKEYLPTDMAFRKSDQTVLADDHEKEEFDKGLKRFLREARTMAKFDHPNVVRVLNVFEENNTAYMTMDYEEGQNLKELLLGQNKISEGKLLSILLPILDGLELVHNANFIHRDIKPTNIMIRKDGSPVLIDFGSAHNVRRETQQVTTLVSPGFTPHEQYTGVGDAQGPWTDIYSLGATLYRCVSGASPVDALTRINAVLRDIDDPLVSAVEAGGKGYSQALLQAIDKAMTLDARHRTQNIAKWRQELTGNAIIQVDQDTTQRLSDKTIRLTPLDGPVVSKPFQASPKKTILASLIVVTIIILLLSLLLFKESILDVFQGSEADKEVAVATSEEAGRQGPAILVDKLKDGSDAPTLITLPKGSFLIGSAETEPGRQANEGPRRQVHILEPIALGKTEISVAQFRKFVEDTNYITDAEANPDQGCLINQNGWNWQAGYSWRRPGYPQTDQHPVVCVSWNDAVAYSEWLSEQTSSFYILPSEAVWEYAARSGTSFSRFWGGNSREACQYANISDLTRASTHLLSGSEENIFVCEDQYHYTAPVASFQENPYGLFDMLGNVWEWTADCWNDSYRGLPLNGKPRLTGNCDNRIYRGGGWGNLPHLVRAAKRGNDPRHFRYYNVGFRIGKLFL